MDARRLQQALAKASTQAGHLTRHDLAAAGWTRHDLSAARAAGLLVVAGTATYRLASEPVTWQGRVRAATLDTSGVASHRTAAAIHGLVDRCEPIEVLVARSSGRRPSRTTNWGGVLAHTTTNLPAEDRLVVMGVPVTSVARTLLSLAAVTPSAEVACLVQRAVDRGMATMPWLWWLLEERRCRGRTGVRSMEEALARIEGLAPTESWLEREFLAVIRAAGLPEPETQRVIRRARRFVARVDFVYEDERVVIEVLGYQFHRTRAQLDADTRRANELQLLGYAVLQFTYDAVVRTPMQVASDVQRALAA